MLNIAFRNSFGISQKDVLKDVRVGSCGLCLGKTRDDGWSYGAYKSRDLASGSVREPESRE